MNLPKVAVVIIHWNNLHLLAQFLPSVCESSYQNLEIIVADNASTDASIAWLSQHYPNIRIIKLDKNYGYAGGYNRALQQVKADYFVLLNNDVEVTQNWIEPIISLFESDKNIGAIQPKLLQYKQKDTFEYAGAAGGYIDTLGYVCCRGRLFESIEKDLQQYDDSKEIFWASGACLFVRAEAFFKAGGFDEHFFAHMEEIDLCWRMQQAGYSIWYVAESKVYHLGGSTLQKGNPQKTYLNFRNSLLMLLKNMPASKLWWFIPWRSFLDLLSSFFFLMRSEPKHSWAVHRAHADFFFKLGFWIKLRKNGLPKKEWKDLKGVHHKSLIWEHFIEKKERFSDL
jgi:hypothetical protein